MATCTSLYTSCACNRTPNSVDWGDDDCVIYAGCNAIVVASFKNGARVLQTAVKHKARVNCVSWIRSDGQSLGSPEFVSASTDKNVIVWRQVKAKFELVSLLQGHSSTVILVRAIYLPREGKETIAEESDRCTLIASASVDSSVRIWARNATEDFSCIQTISMGTGFANALSFLRLPKANAVMLAVAGDDKKIHLYIRQKEDFLLQHSLLGHDDWIRSVDMVMDDGGDILVASAAQDTFIRMWRVSPRQQSEVKVAQRVRDLSLDQDIKLEEETFSFTSCNQNFTFAVSLESVLAGHENWVYSVQWQRSVIKDGKKHQPLSLLSASMDKTMILWQPDPDSGMWLEQVRVGEVGGNTLGFYGGVFNADGNSILAHGYQGAFHLWNKQGDSWKPGLTVGGHFNEVTDLVWSPEGGQYLLSVSSDQTTRLHAYWQAEDENMRAWYEVGRPQVHGYDMTCITHLKNFSFASGADEKVIRVFHAPRNVIENLSKLIGVECSQTDSSSAPEGASVPALGLSNKAVYNAADQERSIDDKAPLGKSQYNENVFAPITSEEPPTEENLVQNTLWPEVQKLYGHGFEIFCLASDPQSTVLASACKASKTEHAAIIIWDTSTWKQLCSLPLHSLTVTDMLFSHDGSHLLSVSRDRTWCLSRRRNENQPSTDPLFQVVHAADKRSSGHSRIIWSCAWSHDDQFFITVSRDKKGQVWTAARDDERVAKCGLALELDESITAVDFAPQLLANQSYLMAFGLESGQIDIYAWNLEREWVNLLSICDSGHHLAIKRLMFKPEREQTEMSTGKKCFLLGSCGMDHMVRINQLAIT